MGAGLGGYTAVDHYRPPIAALIDGVVTYITVDVLHVHVVKAAGPHEEGPVGVACRRVEEIYRPVSAAVGRRPPCIAVPATSGLRIAECVGSCGGGRGQPSPEQEEHGNEENPGSGSGDCQRCRENGCEASLHLLRSLVLPGRRAR